MPQVCAICWEAFWAPKCPWAESQTMSRDIGDYDFVLVSMTQEPPINMTDTSIEYCITQWHEHNEHITYMTININELCWLCSIFCPGLLGTAKDQVHFSAVFRWEASSLKWTWPCPGTSRLSTRPSQTTRTLRTWSFEVSSNLFPRIFPCFSIRDITSRDLLSFVVESNSDVEHRNWTSNLWFHLDMCERCGQRSSDLGNSFLPAVTKCEKRTWQQIHFFSSSLHLVKTGVIIEAGDGDFEVSTKS